MRLAHTDPERESRTTTNEPSTKNRILIFDGQAADDDLLERILSGAGHEVAHAGRDARSLAARVAEIRPDLIVLDLDVETARGQQVLKALRVLRAREGFLPVLALTSDADSGRRHTALALGSDDYVMKPVNADELLPRCRNLLDTRAIYLLLQQKNRALLHEADEQGAELARIQLAHAAIFASLNRLSPAAHVGETASALCRELAQSPLFEIVAVLAFEGSQAVVPIAAGGEINVSRILARALPEDRAARLIARATEGPWAAPWRAGDDDGWDGAALYEAGLRSVWYAPLVHETRVVGVMVAGSSVSPAQPELDVRLPTLVEFAAIARVLIAQGMAAQAREAESRASLLRVIQEERFHPEFQPIVDIHSGEVMGFEALTRFADGQRPDLLFEEASRLGVGHALEEATLSAALAASHALPVRPFLSLNVSPSLLGEREVLLRLLSRSRRLVVLEITEHVEIDDYATLREAIVRLGPQVRLAIDDAGAGYASFRHILELRPDFVKIDRGLVTNINSDLSRQALVASMRHFAQKTGCTLISEGVETEPERATLIELGIEFGQGYLFGRPAPPGVVATAPDGAGWPVLPVDSQLDEPSLRSPHDLG